MAQRKIPRLASLLSRGLTDSTTIGSSHFGEQLGCTKWAALFSGTSAAGSTPRASAPLIQSLGPGPRPLLRAFSAAAASPIQNPASPLTSPAAAAGASHLAAASTGAAAGLHSTAPPSASPLSSAAASQLRPLNSVGPAPLPSSSASHSVQSEFGHEDLLVDTLHMMRTLENAGLSREQAELLTRYLTSLLIHQKVRLTAKFVERETVTRQTVDIENRLTQFKSEISKNSEIGIQNIARDVQQAKSDVVSLKAETRFEHEKILGNLKLDFNIEKGRLRDEVKKIEDLVQDLDNKIGQESRNRKASLENEVQAMRAVLEASKSELIKWLLGTATTLIGLAFSGVIVFFRVMSSS